MIGVAVSEMSEPKAVKQYFAGHPSDAAISHDGSALWDIETSDVESVLIDQDALQGGLYESRVSRHRSEPKLKMRKGVKAANLFFDERQNIVLCAAEGLQEKLNELSVECNYSSIVQCLFERGEVGYVAFNPKSYLGVRKLVSWQETTFSVVNSSDHRIHITRLGRLEVDRSTTPKFLESGIKVESFEEFRKKQKQIGFRNELIPEHLVIRSRDVFPIIRLGYRQTLFSADFVRFVNEGPTPGLFFSNIPIEVEFKNGKGS